MSNNKEHQLRELISEQLLEIRKREELYMSSLPISDIKRFLEKMRKILNNGDA